MRVVDYVCSRISAKVCCYWVFRLPTAPPRVRTLCDCFSAPHRYHHRKWKYNLIFLYTYVFLVVNSDTVYYTTLWVAVGEYQASLTCNSSYYVHRNLFGNYENGTDLEDSIFGLDTLKKYKLALKIPSQIPFPH